jgi:translocation and assembly module TamB
MPEENEQREEQHTNEPDDNTPETREREPRRFFTRRNALLAAAVLGVLVVVFVLFTVVSYRYGVFDPYIKAQFTAKMADIGVDFDADVFRVTVNPLAVELKNATFNNRATGEKLFFIRDAQLRLTVQDLYAWQLSRDITVDTTDINGAEVWITFDENGRSNFDELTLVQEGPQRVNFKYDSVKFSLRDAVVHVGDQSRHIGADANNVVFLLEPVDAAAPDDQKRYRLDLTTTGSRFAYQDSVLENIALHAAAIADHNGADVTELKLTSPIGESTMNGRVDDWADPKYNLNIESTVDLTQTSNIFPLGTTLRGVGNFRGTVTGQGENYRVEGRADSEALHADGVYLKAVNVEGTVAGTNSNYEANGKAVAEMLTFEDFRVDFPQLVGNVRGTGTDFRWVGELQAVAAKSDKMSIGRLFLSDAVAELRDKELIGSAGSGRAQLFSAGNLELADLAARNLRFTSKDGVTNISAASGQTRGLNVKVLKLQNASGSDIKVKNSGKVTDVDIARVRAESGQLKDTKLRGVTADSLKVSDTPTTTDLSANNFRADQVELDGSRITGLETPSFTLRDNPAETVIYSDRARIARVESSGAILGSLNIAGIRVTVRQGVIQGTSNDIDAGNVTLAKSSDLPSGGQLDAVKIAKPVFILEPSGRDRASADMSIGGGVLGSINLGAARSSVDVTNDRIALNDLAANIMNGTAEGQAVIARSSRVQSQVNINFTGLDASKLLALQTSRVLPIEGEATGSINITFAGTNFRTATGTLAADISGNAGTDASTRVPVTGRVELKAANGLVTVDQARLNSQNTQLSATGKFDLAGQDSNLNLALNSTDASEVERIARVLGVSPDLERQLDSMDAQFAGNLTFNGSVTGNFTDPTVEGKASLDSLILHGRNIGSISTDLSVSPLAIQLSNGNLRDTQGGTIAFNANIPRTGENNTTVNATLTNVNAGDLLSALPIDLPGRLREFTGQTSGKVDLSGLPNNASGEINISSKQGTIAGQAFDSMTAKAVFSGTRIDLQNAEIRLGAGSLTANGTYDRATTEFNADVRGTAVPITLAMSMLPEENTSVPNIAGTADFTATATGFYDRPSTYDVNFSGSGHNVAVNENPIGEVTFSGNTVNQELNATLTTRLGDKDQKLTAKVTFSDPNMPFRIEHHLDNSPIAPFIAFIPSLRQFNITGTATGDVLFTGNLSGRDTNGQPVIGSGTARFTQLNLQIQDSPLVATQPVSISFNTREIVFESAHFAGGGTNMTIAGTKALADDASENLEINGRVNLSLLSLFLKDTDAFFAGFADVAVRYAGPKTTARLSGTAALSNASVSTFFGTERLTLDRITTPENRPIIFSANQAQVDEVNGFLGGGRFTASGGALLSGLSIQAVRFTFNGNRVTVPVPEDFTTRGNVRLEIAGRRPSPTENLAVSVVGSVYAEESKYTKDIDLSTIVGARREQSISSGGSSLSNVRFDVSIEGRDALVVQNNIADLRASVSARLTGDAENPIISGRITANGGTIIFRRDRYQIQRGVLEFPPDTTIDPIIDLQAETEIAGYQIFVNLSGPLSDTSQLNATVRSSPALPQSDVVSLITTGSLSNSSGGITAVAQTGINTAADILTDAIISNPARRATDKLFGLNVFELDPLLSGERLNPGARLTVGRQINNNLRVTYSTNLSQDQNQVLAFEYRVSNKVSFVAQYEQRALSNVTRNRDNFSFEIRFRRRF